MKKKFMLAVAMIMTVAVTCLALVGCVPDRPDKFIVAYAKADNIAMTLGEDGAVTAINKGKAIYTKVAGVETYVMIGKDKVETFIGSGENWAYASMTKEEYEKSEYASIETSFDEEKVKEAYKEYTEAFEENFEKDDKGWWTAKKGLGVLKSKVDGKDCLLNVGDTTMFKLTMNYKISLPSAAKAARK